MIAEFNDFARLNIRVGQIVRAEQFPNAHKAAYKLWVDFVNLIQPDRNVGFGQ